MRNTTLLVSTLILGLTAVLVLNITRNEPSTPKVAPEPLIPQAIFDGLQTITVKANNRETKVEKTGTGWTVQNKVGLPADVDNRLAPLLRSLQKAQNFGKLTGNPKRIEKLGLADSSVELTTADGKSFKVEFGKQTEDGVGASARIAGQTFALSTNFSGYLESDPLNWVNLILYSANPQEVKSIALEWQDKQAIFYTRKEKGSPFEGKEAPSIEELISALTVIRAADALPLDDKSIAKATQVLQATLTLFDNSSVKVIFSELPAADASTPAKVFVKVIPSDSTHTAHSLSKQAAFVAAPWTIERLPKSLKELKNAKPAEPQPETIEIPGPAPTVVAPTEIKL